MPQQLTGGVDVGVDPLKAWDPSESAIGEASPASAATAVRTPMSFSGIFILLLSSPELPSSPT